MTIDTQKLRGLIRRAVPLPWTLATSNSWRRILSRDGAAVCSPCCQPDGHPDLHLPGGAEGPTSTLLIEAANSLPALLDHIEALTEALIMAREFVATMREELIVSHGINGVIPADDALGLAGVAECDDILGQIDAALAQRQGERHGNQA